MKPVERPWEEIRAAWGGRDFGRLREVVGDLEAVDLTAVDELFDGPRVAVDQARREIEDVLAVAQRQPDGGALVAAYVYAGALAKWERSSDYGRVEVIVEALALATGARGAGDGSGGAASIAGHAQLLRGAMGAENAVQCSCPIKLAACARRVTGHLRKTPGVAAEQGLEDVIGADAAAQLAYHEALEAVGVGVQAFLERDFDPDSGLDRAIDMLGEAAASPVLSGDVYASELRAHRAGLEALRATASDPFLLLDEGRVIYLYPFSFLDGLELDAIRDGVPRWQLANEEGHLLESAQLDVVGDLELTDVWEHPDVGAASFAGFGVLLPRLVLGDTSGEGAAEEQSFAAEVRFSRLGNHYVRIASTMVDAGPHDLNQALRRASECMGNETLSCGGLTVGKPVELARIVIRAVARAHDATVIGDPGANFHVVLTARRMSVRGPQGDQPVRSLDDVRAAVGGALLLNPIRGVATALEEWVRYPVPQVDDLLGGIGRIGDFAVRTANTTVLYRPESPAWSHAAYAEIAEFTASLAPLLASWDRAVAQTGDAVARRLDEITSREHEVSQRGQGGGLGDVLDMEARLRAHQGRVRARLAHLRSPTLVRERVYRRFLDDLWSASALPALEADLERQLDYTASLLERLAAMETGIEEQRKERVDRYLELGLVLLSVASLSELFGWVNDSFDVEGITLPAIQGALLLGLATVLGVMVLRKRMRR